MTRGFGAIQVTVASILFILPVSALAQIVNAAPANTNQQFAQPTGSGSGSTDAQLAQEEAAILNVLKSKNAEVQRTASATTGSLVSVSQVTTPQVSGTLDDQLRGQGQAIDSLKDAKRALEDRVLRAEAKVAKVMRELEHTREELLLAETEVERLSHIIEQRNIQSLSKLTKARATSPIQKYQKSMAPRKSAVMDNPGAQEVKDQLPIATVVVDNANLRTGPGLGNSVLLQVSRNNRLVVEKRDGSWYRVIAPTGERAWISGEVIQFGPTKDSRPTSTVRLKGITEKAEVEPYSFQRTSQE